MNPTPIRRRTVTSTALWASPVLAVGALAPSAAASGCPSDPYTVTASPTGDWGYDQISVEWKITNTGPEEWAAGTLITWAITPTGRYSQDLYMSITAIRQFFPTSSDFSPVLLSNAVLRMPGTFLLEVVEPVPVDGFVLWRGDPTIDFRYTSVISVGLADCVPGKACANVTGYRTTPGVKTPVVNTNCPAP